MQAVKDLLYGTELVIEFDRYDAFAHNALHSHALLRAQDRQSV